MRMSLYTQEEIDAMKWDRAVNEGISIGEARGVSRGLRDVAQNMRKLGFSEDDIQRVTKIK